MRRRAAALVARAAASASSASASPLASAAAAGARGPLQQLLVPAAAAAAGGGGGGAQPLPSWWGHQPMVGARAMGSSSSSSSSSGSNATAAGDAPPSSSSSRRSSSTTPTQLPPLDVPALLRAVADADHSAHLTPEAVVRELDRHVVGQAEAKRAVASAFRARWRRRRVPDAELREAITPKNLLLLGNTGTGKTEIARRLAKLADAPFVKTEASSYTETGYHGRDVDQIARDLVESAVGVVRARLRRLAEPHVKAAVEQKLLRAVAGAGRRLERMVARMERREAAAEGGGAGGGKQPHGEEESAVAAKRSSSSSRASSSSSSASSSSSLPHVVRQNPLARDSDDDEDNTNEKDSATRHHAAEAAASAARASAAAAAAAAAADRRRRALAKLRAKLRAGDLDDAIVEVDVPPPSREAQGLAGGRGGGGGSGGGGGGGASLTIVPPTAGSPGGSISFTPSSSSSSPSGGGGGDMTINLASLLGGLFRGFGGRGGGGRGGGGDGSGAGGQRRRLPVKDARVLLEEAEAEALFPPELIAKEALRAAAEEGIVFIDEIDKIVQPAGAYRHGSDPSSEGVQRDLLPLLEGSGTVQTRLGPLSTQHVLFIAAGAFHHCSASDMMPELQGRLPVRVQLKPLDADDFLRILTEPAYSAVEQQRLLLGAEGVSLRVTEGALRAIAVAAERANARTDDIGARRLHAVLERLLEEASFRAPELVVAARGEGGGGGTGENAAAAAAAPEYVVDADMVDAAMAEVFKEEDVAKYIL